jgi:hypothetical protein
MVISLALFNHELSIISYIKSYFNTNKEFDETALPCEFCGELIKAQDLIQHQVSP